MNKKRQQPREPIDIFFEMRLDKWHIFDSKTLASSKIVLLHNLKPMVDMFNADGVGLGIRTATEVITELKLTDHDRSRLIALMSARSFDVYSVRAALNDFLSDSELAQIQIPKKEAERLQKYMNTYSQGLLRVILEGTNVKVTDRSSLTTILEGANRGAVLKNLLEIAGRLRIEPSEIVVYISKLSEIILALSYYQRVYDSMLEDLREVLADIKALNEEVSIRSRFPGIKEETQEAINAGRQTVLTLNGYFDQFHKIERIFEEITPEKFRKIREAVEVHHRAIGMIVCFWQIKIAEWRKRFWDARGRRKDSTWEQRYNFFKEVLCANIHTVGENVELIKDFKLDL